MNIYEKLEYLESKGWKVEQEGIYWKLCYPEEHRGFKESIYDICSNLDTLIKFSFEHQKEMENK